MMRNVFWWRLLTEEVVDDLKWVAPATMVMLAKQVSLELAVRVLTLVLHWCPPSKRHAYMRSLEKTAALLTSRGRITGAEVGSHQLLSTFIVHSCKKGSSVPVSSPFLFVIDIHAARFK